MGLDCDRDSPISVRFRNKCQHDTPNLFPTPHRHLLETEEEREDLLRDLVANLGMCQDRLDTEIKCRRYDKQEGTQE